MSGEFLISRAWIFEEQKQKGESLKKVWPLISLWISFESLMPRLLSGGSTLLYVRGDRLVGRTYGRKDMFLSSLISRDNIYTRLICLVCSWRAPHLRNLISRILGSRRRQSLIMCRDSWRKKNMRTNKYLKGIDFVTTVLMNRNLIGHATEKKILAHQCFVIQSNTVCLNGSLVKDTESTNKWKTVHSGCFWFGVLDRKSHNRCILAGKLALKWAKWNDMSYKGPCFSKYTACLEKMFDCVYKSITLGHT